jgi:hypothetical protein
VASGVLGYRAELTGQRRRILRLGTASLGGGLVGAILLLTLPQGAFKSIVPALIGVAVVMVLIQPRLAAWVAARQQGRAAPSDSREPGTAGPGTAGPGTAGPGTAGGELPGVGGAADAPWATAVAVPVTAPAPSPAPALALTPTPAAETLGGPVTWVLVFLAGIYGGYFGAAQGVLLIGLLGITLGDTLQRINAVKNVLCGLVNGLAAVVFVIATQVDWGAAGLIAAGSIIGGQLGARIGRRLPPWGLRVLIVCVGVTALVRLLA